MLEEETEGNGQNDGSKIADATLKLAPELTEAFVRRYQVLKTIHLLEPVGRRTVATYLDNTERVIRGEVEHLVEQDLISVSKGGMSVTYYGKEILTVLETMVTKLSGISKLEDAVREVLGVEKVVIVSGDCDKNETVKRDLGMVAAKTFLRYTNKKSKIAITGGSTMAELISSMPYCSAQSVQLVVPARGSIGSKVEFQADTLVAQLAEKLKSAYLLLRIPDSMSKRILDEIKNEPDIRYTITGMEQADTLVFGIGNAVGMAKKRKVSDTVYQFLIRKRAVGEAFGYYFNKAGEIVYVSRTIGIPLENILKMKCIIGVAGGAKKAESLLSVSRNMKRGIFVIDEGAAREILALAGK